MKLNPFLAFPILFFISTSAFSQEIKIFQPLPRLLSRGEVVAPLDQKSILVALDLGPINKADIALIKLHADGKLDKNFGQQGIFRDETPDAERVFGMGIQKDGRIILAGFEKRGKSKNLLILGIKKSGKLDTSFGEHGRVVLDLAGNEEAHYLQLLPDDRIVVAGFVERKNNHNFLVARFSKDGLLDPSFSKKGWVELDHGDEDRFYGLTLSQNKIVATGSEKTSTGTHCVLAAFLPDGQSDMSFGTQGFVTIKKEGLDTACSAIVSDGPGFWMTGYSKGAGETKALLAYLDIVGDVSFTDMDQDFQIQMAHAIVVNDEHRFVTGEGIKRVNKKSKTGFFIAEPFTSNVFIPLLPSGLDLESASMALDEHRQLWITGHVRSKLVILKVAL